MRYFLIRLCRQMMWSKLDGKDWPFTSRLGHHHWLRWFSRDYPAHPRAEQAFWTDYINADFDYYMCGSDKSPAAIIGVKKKFRLANFSMWTPIDPVTHEKLIGVVRKMFFNSRMQSQPKKLCGNQMFDQNGGYVGDWFSPWGATTNINTKDKLVYISPPQLPQPTRSKPL